MTTPSPESGGPELDQVIRLFADEGFDLVIRSIATGRHLAEATNACGGAGPVAMGDTPARAVRLAWERFETHRDHYTTPGAEGPAEPHRGTPLRRVRRARGLTQRGLAAAARVSVSTVNRLEVDQRAVPTEPVRTAIAQALGANVAEVFPHLPR